MSQLAKIERKQTGFSLPLDMQYQGFNVQLTLLEQAHFPDFPGTLLHGGFGHAVAAVSRELLDFMRILETATGVPKPYRFVPAPLLKTTLQPGDKWSFKLIVFGDRTQASADIILALLHWQGLGLGKERAKFKIDSIALLDADAHRLGQQTTSLDIKTAQSLPAPKTLAEYLNSLTTSTPTSSSMLGVVSAESPLHLKFQHQHLHSLPEPHHLQFMIYRRLDAIARGYFPGYANTQAARFYMPDLLPFACQTKTLEEHDYTVVRFGKREQAQRAMKGITGKWSLNFAKHSEYTEFVKAIQLSQVIGLGNKTTFGFGQLAWQPIH